MKNIFKKINELLDLNDQANVNQLLEKIFIKKYGSKNDEVVKRIKLLCSTDEEFQNKLCEEISDKFNIFLEISSHFNNVTGVKTLAKSITSFQDNNPLEKLSREELKELNDFIENDVKPTISEKLDITNEVNRKRFINEVSENFITLKKTREELECENQRTFEKWLLIFFGEGYPVGYHKFSDKGANNGYINLSEYIEIVSAFLLSYDEEKIDLTNKSKEYSERFENGIMVSKEKLKTILSTYNARLKENIEDWSGRRYNDEDIALTVSKSRKFPNSLASSIIDDVRNNYIK
jgi:DNA-binding MarR family transcriptional regulator